MLRPERQICHQHDRPHISPNEEDGNGCSKPCFRITRPGTSYPSAFVERFLRSRTSTLLHHWWRKGIRTSIPDLLRQSTRRTILSGFRWHCGPAQTVHDSSGGYLGRYETKATNGHRIQLSKKIVLKRHYRHFFSIFHAFEHILQHSRPQDDSRHWEDTTFLAIICYLLRTNQLQVFQRKMSFPWSAGPMTRLRWFLTLSGTRFTVQHPTRLLYPILHSWTTFFLMQNSDVQGNSTFRLQSHPEEVLHHGISGYGWDCTFYKLSSTYQPAGQLSTRFLLYDSLLC